MGKVTTVPISNLVEDLSLYPRHAIDEQHVHALALAEEAGHVLPPVIADRKSKRVTDGFHRIRARRRRLGPEASIEVILKDYPSESEMIEDAVRMNSAHGRKLDSMDLTRSALMLQQHGLPMHRIALALHVPESRVERIVLKVAKARTATDATVPGTQTVTLKRSVSHMAGKTLTREQAIAHQSAPGVSYSLIARQLTDALATGLANREDERLIAALKELRREIASFVAA